MFEYSPSNINELERTISTDRFDLYLRRVGGDRGAAILEYEKNTRLSEAFYGVIQGIEVSLRNCLHDLLLAGTGRPDWYDLGFLNYEQSCAVSNALDKIRKRRKPTTPGRVVAELSFGFWTALVGRHYEKTLWVPHLHKAFVSATMEKRDFAGGVRVVHADRHHVSRRLDQIRQLRNRIAHHECILGFDLNLKYVEILEAIHWLCPTTRNWVESSNRYEGLTRPGVESAHS